MIAPSSLPAFAPVQPANQVTRVAAPGARAAQGEAVQKPLQLPPTGGPPLRATPRGSLLDLSV